GLLGKLLGPAGLVATSAAAGDLPPRMLALLALNDLVWWIPFGLFLLEGRSIGARIRGAAPYACAVLHAAAGAAMLLVLRAGTEAEADPAARAAYIRGHAAAWRLGFGVWMAAGMSVLGFYAWWGARARASRLALLALAAAGAGVACDLVGEALYAGWLPWLASEVAAGAPGALARFSAVQRLGTVLTAVFANGLYTVAGIVLTLATPQLPRTVRALAWVAWAAGVLLAVAGLLGRADAMVAASAVLFPALVCLCLAVGRRLR
ncbi:MAG TPA: hypothetical protein VEW03_14235, partial [Longimicrobiaceae bacterium]|nr:hypothetical protein [Longimicrobiaceae bacterium]